MSLISNGTPKAFKRFLRAIKQVETESGLRLIQKEFVQLVGAAFLQPTWLHPSQLATIAKYLVPFGAKHAKKPWFDQADLLNPYKDFWAAAEAEKLTRTTRSFWAHSHFDSSINSFRF